METGNFKTLSLDDIVFAGRNKLYGAYLLRRLYNRHITMAALIASALFLLLISMPLLARLLADEKEIPPAVGPAITKVVLDTPPPLPPIEKIIPPAPPVVPPSSPPPAQKQVKFTPPVVKPDAAVLIEETIPDAAELKGVNVGVKTIEGEAGGIPDIGVPDGTGTAIIEEAVPEKPVIFAEQMPTFPGGERAMFEYLSKHLKYPRQAIAAGIEGQVFVSFVVGRNGEISEVQVLRGLGGGCDEEAIRVIQGMPLWMPGKQNGRTVPVRYNIPVKFTLK